MKLVILDRDGVINYDSKDYIKSPEEWRPIPGSLEAIAKLNRAGYQVVVATNQSGVARGLYTITTLTQIHEKMRQALANVGGHVNGIFFCPHGPDDNCNCRKPKPGLFLQIAQQFQIDLTTAIAIGDSQRDLEAAQSVGCKSILVLTGNGKKTLADTKNQIEVIVVENLAAAVTHLLVDDDENNDD